MARVKASEEKKLSVNAYASSRKITEHAIRKAIKTGRIVKGCEKAPRGRGYLIIPSVADREMAANTHPGSGQRGHLRNAGKNGNGKVGDEYAQSRATISGYQAKLAKIDYEKAIGKLVDAEEVRRAAFNLARTVRNALLNVPDRVASLLAAEADPTRCHELLTAEIRKVLDELSR